jgi:hypothetical protein
VAEQLWIESSVLLTCHQVVEESEVALAKLRTAISNAVDKHDPAVLTYGKPDWRYFVFPHVPLAGSNVSIYVNKATNDIIRCGA